MNMLTNARFMFHPSQSGVAGSPVPDANSTLGEGGILVNIPAGIWLGLSIRAADLAFLRAREASGGLHSEGDQLGRNVEQQS